MDRVNVDTDQILPKQFMKLLTREGFGRFLFFDWRYLNGSDPDSSFVLNRPRYRGASILLTRANFGCGSSREHAPWAILDYGFRAILAPSFADIFHTNCLKNGILPVILTDDEIDELFIRTTRNEGYGVLVDLNAQTVEDNLGLKLRFAIDPFQRDCLLRGLDEVGLTLAQEERIKAFENHSMSLPVLYEPQGINYRSRSS